MAVTAKLYSNFVHLVNEGKVADLSSAGTAIKVALATSSYTPDQNTHDYFDDITNELSTGDGYTAGGATLASKTMTVSTTTATFDAADTTWTSATITARYAIIYYATGTAGTSTLIGYVDFGENKTSTAGTFTIQWSALGIFSITVA